METEAEARDWLLTQPKEVQNDILKRAQITKGACGEARPPKATIRRAVPRGDPGGRRRPGFEGERGPCHPRGRGPRAREARPAPEGGGNADCGLPDGSRSHEVAGDSVGTLHPGGPVVRGRRPPAEVCHTLGPRGPGPSRGGSVRLRVCAPRAALLGSLTGEAARALTIPP